MAGGNGRTAGGLARELEEELGIQADAAGVPACFASAPLGGRHMILPLYLPLLARRPRPLDATALAWLRPGKRRRDAPRIG